MKSYNNRYSLGQYGPIATDTFQNEAWSESYLISCGEKDLHVNKKHSVLKKREKKNMSH